MAVLLLSETFSERKELYVSIVFICNVVAGIVIGNITDEEVEDMVPPTDTGKEYPLQRDEVQTTLNKINTQIIGKYFYFKYTYLVNITEA